MFAVRSLGKQFISVYTQAPRRGQAAGGRACSPESPRDRSTPKMAPRFLCRGNGEGAPPLPGAQTPSWGLGGGLGWGRCRHCLDQSLKLGGLSFPPQSRGKHKMQRHSCEIFSRPPRSHATHAGHDRSRNLVHPGTGWASTFLLPQLCPPTKSPRHLCTTPALRGIGNRDTQQTDSNS